MRDGGFWWSIPRGIGTSLTGRYAQESLLWPFCLVLQCRLFMGLTVRMTQCSFLGCMKQSNACSGFMCLLKRSWREGRESEWGQHSTAGGRTAGRGGRESRSLLERSLIRQNEQEIALLAAKEFVHRSYYFFVKSLSVLFLKPHHHNMLSTHPHVAFSQLLPKFE